MLFESSGSVKGKSLEFFEREKAPDSSVEAIADLFGGLELRDLVEGPLFVDS